MGNAQPNADADAASAIALPDGAIPRPPTFAEALRYWFKLGCISFGGPAGQIALMHAELVERKRWISERRFLHALNYCMVLPGPEAQQLATYIGWLMHRTAGGLAAGLLFVLPSLLLLIGLSWLYAAQGQQPLVQAVLDGVQPAVVAMFAHAAWRLGRKALRLPLHWVLAAGSFLMMVASVPFPWVLAVAALCGWIQGRRTSMHAEPPASASDVTARKAPAAWIDDDTAPPPHARFAPRRMVLTVATGVVLGAAVFAGLVAWLGPDAMPAQLAAFFTRAALLTFGGAYAVLPYVVQGAVEQHGWLTGPQMLAGLALGESTPGPLIIVVAFVGFLGGWQQPFVELPLLAGVIGAAVVAFFTFLPSFVFILAGAPLVEATRGNLRLTAPLAAISAAVVGVIAHLGLYFAWRVLWPAAGGFDVPALVLAVVAGLALIRFHVAVPWVLVGSAIAGLGWRAVGL